MKTIREYFTDAEESIGSTALYTYVVLALVFTFLYSYGAARLSWCYNISIGNSTGVAFGWSVVNFIFSSIYYPFYALFLNRVCKKK